MHSRKLVVGLGNPGLKYKHTPHNLGFEVVDLLAAEGKLVWESGICSAWMAQGLVQDLDLILIKPRTYMNLSGRCVSGVLERFSFSVEDLVVICDDLALPFGKIRIRGKGSAGGHNGLKSIIESIGSDSFVRVRMGVSPEFEIPDAADYVLAPIPGILRGVVQEMIEKGKEAVKMIASKGLLPAMNQFN